MDISIIYQFDFEQLWELFRGEIRQDPSEGDMKVLAIVKNGNKIRFDIRSLIGGQYQEYPYDQVIIIEGKRHNMFEFFDELDDRKDLMRKWLKQNWGNTSLGKAREKTEVDVLVSAGGKKNEA
jgi:hypothetical protein